MFKKLGIAALVIVAGLFVLQRLDLLPYVKSSLNKAQQDLRQSIPPERKIERLKDELSRLPEETGKYRTLIAREKVAVDRLTREIATSEANLVERETQIKNLRAELRKDEDAGFVRIGGERIPRDKVEATLARQWESFKAAKDAVASQKEVLTARKEALEIATQKLDTMLSKKQELEAKIAQLESELRKVRLAQTRHDLQIDDGALSRINKLYEEVETQIAVEKTELEMQKAVFTDSQVEEAMNRKAKADKALKEMDAHFDAEKVAVERK
jgi:chromosome segregation ATPase